MPVDDEVVLNTVELEYPSLVREKLAESDHDCLSASVCEEGYAWFVIDKELFIWKYRESESSSLVVLNLPPSGLPFTTRTVYVYSKPDSPLPGVIAVSPEGTIRHWPTLGRQFTDSSVDLNREVALSLQPLSRNFPSDVTFLLSTTTCSFYTLQLESIEAPTPGKRQRFCSTISTSLVYTKSAKRSLTRRVTSAFFGDSNQHGSRLLRTIIYEGEFQEEQEEAFDEIEARPTFLAVSLKQMHFFTVHPPAKIWTCDVDAIIGATFAPMIWSLTENWRDSHEKIKTSVVDAVRIGNGVLVLASCSNIAVSTQLHFALAYFAHCTGEQPPKKLDWFSQLDLPVDTPFREEDSQKISLCLPETAQSTGGAKSEILTVVTPTIVFCVQLPKLEYGTEILSLKGAPYYDQLISADCDASFCYVFLRENGICQVRLFPKGFDIGVSKEVKEFNKNRSLSSHTSQADYDLLADAFTLFCAADLDTASSVVQQLTDVRTTAIANLCINYALTIVDGVPNDERWVATGRPTAGRAILLGSSFLLPVQIEEQKKRVLDMFVLFIKYMNLDTKFELVASSKLSRTRSARSQLCELVEKTAIARCLCNWSVDRSVPVFDAAVDRVLIARGERLNDLLTPYDYFFCQISRVDDILSALIEEEKERIANCVELPERISVAEDVGTIIIVLVNAAEQTRDDEVVETANDLRWTQDQHVFSRFMQHLDIAFALMRDAARQKLQLTRIRHDTFALAAFVLAEQDPEERLGSPVVRAFFEVGQLDVGVELAKRYEDYQTLLDYAEELPEGERRSKLAEYKEMFKSPLFYRVLHEHYLTHGHLEALLKEKGRQAEDFFATHSSVSWIREVANGKYEKASRSLKTLAQRREDDVKAKKLLLSFAKLSALCVEEADEEVLGEIKGGLDLVKHQEAVPYEHLQKYAHTSEPGVLRPLSAEEIIQANLNDKNCDAESHFRALLVLASLHREPSTNSQTAVIKSLKTKIWVSSVKADNAFWKEKKKKTPSLKRTVYHLLLARVIEDETMSDAVKLKLLPDVDELIAYFTELRNDQTFCFAIREEEEFARREVPLWRKRRQQAEEECEQ